jgi:hypothetical protein
MAIKYIDPENGNDANDGSSFALRVRSWTSGLTAARIAPGDEIRMIASPDPASMGSATWTNGSGDITLAAAKNVTIDNCEVAWTASTNVTSSLQLSRKQGANCVRLVPATAFTTGKIAYRTLPATLDLSSYQQVSFWYYAGQAPSVYTLQLCSDTTGDAVVNSLAFTLMDTVSASSWRVMVLNFGAALGSGINSVSLLANTDPATTTIQIDNIVACKAPSDADCLTHLHLIGKSTVGEPEWYALSGIDGVTLSLGSDTNSVGNSNPPRPYVGETESVTAYSRRPLFGGDLAAATATRTLQESGTASLPNIVSGGWNRTDMSTQTGQTWISGSHAYSNWISFTFQSYWSFSNIGTAHFTSWPITGSSGTYVNFDMLGVVACTSAWSLNSGPNELKFGNVMQCGEGIRGQTFTTHKMPSRIQARRISGCTNATQGALSTPSGLPGFRKLRFYVDKIDNNAGYALKPGTAVEGGTADIIGTTFDSSGPSSLQFFGENMHDITFINCTIPNIPGIFWNSSNVDEALRFQKVNGSATDHRIYTPHWSLQSDTSTVHTVDGLSWALRPTNATNILNASPAEFPLGQVAFENGNPVVIKAWLRRSNTLLTLGIKVNGGYVAGLANDLTAEITAAADTWQEVTLTFTPTEAGVIEVFGYGYGGTTHVGYFDDLTITQV